MHGPSVVEVVWRREWPAGNKRKEQTFIRSLPCARLFQISYLIFKMTPQVVTENPILQMSKMGLSFCLPSDTGLKLNIPKTKILASRPITSWQIDGETMETMTDFIFLGSKITADGDCSHIIKRCLLLGRKVMTNLDSILKSRDITLPTKVHPVKATAFPVWLFPWSITSCMVLRINWCFWTVMLEKTLKSPLDRKKIKTSQS